MRNILFIVLSLLVSSASAQTSLLYEVSGNGLNTNSYLFGTIHMNDEAAFQWNDRVFQALDACETAAFELNLDLDNLKEEFDTVLFQKIFFYLVDDLVPAMMENYPPEQLADNLIDHILPFYQQLLSAKFKGDRRMLVVDQYLQKYAESTGKTVWGIETVDEQLKAFTGSDMNAWTQRIVEALDTNSLKQLETFTHDQEVLLEAYGQMDMERVCTIISQVGDVSDPWTNGFYNRLLDQRNEVMAERVFNRIKGESVFVAVGAGHLCGETGLVAQLKGRGYTVTPIDLSGKTAHLELNWVAYEGDGFSTQVPQGIDSVEYGGWGFLSMKDNQNTHRSLFTPQGMAVFKVEEYAIAEEAVDWMGDWEGEDQAAEESESDVEWESPVEEAVDYESAVEIEEWESSDEGMAEEGTYDEMDMVEDAEFEEYERSEPSRRPGPFGEVLGSVNPMEHITPEMQQYFMTAFMQIQMKAPDFKQQMKPWSEELMASEDQEQLIQVNGQEVVLFRTFSPLENRAYCTIELPDGPSFELSISGDPQVIRSEAILPFFTQFKIQP